MLAVRRQPARMRFAGAFTLVELILVMALLVIVIGTAAPSLSHFFSGRTLDTEANRFVALTRYGQSQAVSEGTPMVLWVDQKVGSYGLRQEAGLSPVQWQSSLQGPQQRNKLRSEEPWSFQLAKDLRFELDASTTLTNGLGYIRFQPDGSIDEGALAMLMIEGKNQDSIPIVRSRNQLFYEIAHQTNLWGRWYP
jgi:Tfp pilus assembly protein FimT